jgi:glucokinase
MGNDATVAALGEHVFGDGRDVDDLVYFTVSTGIGGGVITGGQLLTGAWGMAGELGHIFLAPDGPLGKCGHRGCLESLACGEMIAERAKEAVAAGKKTSLAKLPSGSIKTKDVFQAARENDPVASEIVRAAAVNLGRGIASLVHVFNPQKVILGGGVTKSWEMIQPVMEKTVRGLLMPGFTGRLEIVRTRFGDDIGLLGAAALAIRERQIKK